MLDEALADKCDQAPLLDLRAAGLTASPEAAGHMQAMRIPSSSSGWPSRLLGRLSLWRPRGAGSSSGIAPTPKSAKGLPVKPPGSGGPRLRDDEIGQLVKRLIAADRYAFVLLKGAIDEIDEIDAHDAWDVLRKQMALVPYGRVAVVLSDRNTVTAEIGAFFLDRHAVSNRQFQKFVDAGGYDELEIWPSKIWPSVARFTDRTGQPGPRDWVNGRFPAQKHDHPVVGVCWYEAVAYATWVGKRLPIAAEWQKAGGWPEQLSGGGCNRYPWGDLFESSRANLASARIGGTLPVGALPNGATPNGIYQMTGNTWEWLDDPLESIACEDGHTFVPWKAMRRIVGGAYNTYFANEATCHFITGQGDLDRRENIGFRCAISADALRPLPEFRKTQ